MALERVEKPWGYELIWAHTDRYVGKILHIYQGEALSFQYHRTKDETIYLLNGIIDLEICKEVGERRTIRLRPGDGYHIHAGLRHSMIALEECDLLEASTPELDDIVRLEDRYGRVK